MNMKCTLCPQECDVDRKLYKGYCNSGENIRISRSDLHMWEEECISGENGSGTIFFSGCNLQCVFCQNQAISRGEVGKIITTKELADSMLELQSRSANNINLVTAAHFLPKVIEAIDIARKAGLSIPIVYNTSSYEKAEAIRSLNGYVDVYLPDFKYYSNELALKYSKVPDYSIVATKAIDEMVRQCPEVIFDDRGIITKGVIIRHLILPGHTNDSKNVLKYLHERYGSSVYISIMNQYTPMGRLENYPELDRMVTKREYDKVVDYAVAIGIENGYIQEGNTASESFIPDFDVSK